MDDKTFRVVGVSTKQGVTKMRFANGTAAARKRVLENDGHTAIDLRDLPDAMSKEAAARWWQTQGGQAVLALDGPMSVRETQGFNNEPPTAPTPRVSVAPPAPDDGTPWMPPGLPPGQTWYDAPLPPAHMIKAWGPNGPINPPHPRTYWPWKPLPALEETT